jgi:hypothetical protein
MIQTNRTNRQFRLPYLVLFSGSAFSWSQDSLAVAPAALPYVGVPALTVGQYPQMCAWSEGSDAIAYATAGTLYTYKVFAGAGGVVVGVGNTSGGTAPTAQYLCCIYQGRLVQSDGQNVYMSRAGDHEDWDYAKTDLGAAVELNTFLGLNTNDNILALIPFANDSLLLACTQSLYLLTGNPRDGGRLELLSRNVGILGAKAWCYHPTGAVYFADVSGLWRMTADGSMKNLSRDRIVGYFETIERSSYLTHLVWDEIHKGCFIFFSHKASAASLHLWFDERRGGLWPQQIPTTQGPVSSIYYEGNLLTDRRVLLGGRDGKVRAFDSTAKNDDGTAISSVIYLGPAEAVGPGREAMCVALDATLGENPTGFINSDWNLDLQLHSGFDPYSVSFTPEQTLDFTSYTAPGRQDTQACRVAGNTHVLRLSNSTLNKIWALDRAVLHMHVSGKEDGRVI